MLQNSNIIDRVEDCGNGYGWSIICWHEDLVYGNCYEIAVLKYGTLCYDSGITTDVIRGDWTRMEEVVKEIKCITNNE
jgi:hypothetical protein